MITRDALENDTIKMLEIQRSAAQVGEFGIGFFLIIADKAVAKVDFTNLKNLIAFPRL